MVDQFPSSGDWRHLDAAELLRSSFLAVELKRYTSACRFIDPQRVWIEARCLPAKDRPLEVGLVGGLSRKDVEPDFLAAKFLGRDDPQIESFLPLDGVDVCQKQQGPAGDRLRLFFTGDRPAIDDFVLGMELDERFAGAIPVLDRWLCAVYAFAGDKVHLLCLSHSHGPLVGSHKTKCSFILVLKLPASTWAVHPACEGKPERLECLGSFLAVCQNLIHEVGTPYSPRKPSAETNITNIIGRWPLGWECG